MTIISAQVRETQLLSTLGTLLDQNGWSTIGDPFVRLAFPAWLTKPHIVRFTLDSDSDERRVTLSKNLYDVEDYTVYGDGVMNGAHVSETTETDTTVTLIFRGVDNSTPVEVAVYYSDIKKDDIIPIHVAEHQIVMNGMGHLFGIAQYGVIEKKARDIGQPIPYCFYPNYSNPARTWGTEFQVDHSMFWWAENNREEHMHRHALYFYQLETYPNSASNLYEHLIPWENEDDLKRAALDMEVLTAQWGLDNESKLTFQITQEQRNRYQSPIVESFLRLPQAESILEIGGLSVKQTNWWSDSQIRISGSIIFSSAMLILNVDTAPVWEKNATPSVPVYLGSLETDFIPSYDGPNGNAALFAGTALKSTASTLTAAMNQSESFDYSDPEVKASTTIFPLLKTKSYYSNPSNGIDSIMVRRNRWGARYQAHYLQWNTAPNVMPPERVNPDTDGMYPRAWNRYDNPTYNHQFNPSRYSGKVHASKAQVVHPEDGVYGSLRDVILVAPYSLEDGDELEVETDPCSVGGVTIYEYRLTEAISPLTKRPGTAFRPAAVGIRQN